jgi:hypothetical protein
MADLHVGYRPPQSYMDKYQDADFFNYQYNKYIEGLHAIPEESSPSTA